MHFFRSLLNEFVFILITTTTTIIIIIIIIIIINNDLVLHKQVKISDIISRRFGDFMTPLSRVEMRLKLTMRVQELQLIYTVEVVTQIL